MKKRSLNQLDDGLYTTPLNIILDGEVDEAMFSKLCETYNRNAVLTKVFLRSSGGCIEVAEAIEAILNEYAKTTLLIGYGYLESAAFSIFFRSKCPKSILPNCHGAYHQSKIRLHITSDGRPYNDEDDFMKIKVSKDLDEQKEALMKDINMPDWGQTLVRDKKNAFFSNQEMKDMLLASHNKFNDPYTGDYYIHKKSPLRG